MKQPNKRPGRSAMKLKYIIDSCISPEQIDTAKNYFENFIRLNPDNPAIAFLECSIYKKIVDMTIIQCKCGWAGQHKELTREFVPDSDCVSLVHACPDCGREESFMKK